MVEHYILNTNSPNVSFSEFTNITFNNNRALHGNGGAIYLNDSYKITFKDNSLSNFVNNIARNNGGGNIL